MNPKFVHLKLPQTGIAKSSYVSLDDVGLVMTPKTRSDMKYRNSFGHIANDPIMFTLFTGFSYDNLEMPMSRNNFSKDRTFFDNAMKVCYTNSRENFFGFPNIAALNYYFMMLYGIHRHHPNEDYKFSLKKEMEALNEIFLVHDRKEGYTPLFKALDNGVATYTKSFDTYVKNLVDWYADEMNQTAIQNLETYNSAIMQYRGVAHVLMDEAAHSHSCEHEFGTDFFHPRGCILMGRHVKNFLAQSIKTDGNKVPKIVSDASQCHIYRIRSTEEIPEENQSVFTKMIDFSYENHVSIYPLHLQSVLILKQDRESMTLDTTLDEVYSMYHKQVAKMHPTGDWNAAIVTDVDEYRQYQADINELTKKLGIKATTKKTVSPKHSDSKFKLKIYYNPRGTNTLVKVIRWITEQDKEAKITNRTGFRNTKYKATSGVANARDILIYAEKKSHELFQENVPKRDNLYYCFLQDCKNAYMSRHDIKYTKLFEYCAKGWMDDTQLLSMMVDIYLSTQKVTFSMKCSDIKQLKKLKLLGIQFDNIEYDIADRKEVLEYFQNY